MVFYRLNGDFFYLAERREGFVFCMGLNVSEYNLERKIADE